MSRSDRVPATTLRRCVPAAWLLWWALLPLAAAGSQDIRAPQAQTQATEVAVPLADEAGQTLLLRSRRRADYGPLSQEFLTQTTLSFCGVASAVMVLNSLQVPAPASGYGPYPYWTQDNIFQVGRGGPSATSVLRGGMTLAQLAELLAGRGLAAEVIHAEGLELEALRALLRRSLADAEDRLLVNYDRREVGQSGGGHISPLAAYDDGSDRVLILDVARYRYPAVWMPLRPLWLAMRSRDPSSGRSRGLVRVRRLSGGTAAPSHQPAAPPPRGNDQPRVPS